MSKYDQNSGLYQDIGNSLVEMVTQSKQVKQDDVGNVVGMMLDWFQTNDNLTIEETSGLKWGKILSKCTDKLIHYRTSTLGFVHDQTTEQYLLSHDRKCNAIFSSLTN
jgi:hypothetical protein